MKNRKLRRREKMTPDDTYRKIRVNGVEHVLYPTLYVTMNRRVLAARIGRDGNLSARMENLFLTKLRDMLILNASVKNKEMHNEKSY